MSTLRLDEANLDKYSRDLAYLEKKIPFRMTFNSVKIAIVCSDRMDARMKRILGKLLVNNKYCVSKDRPNKLVIVLLS